MPLIRALLSLALAVALLASATPAHAGTYTVRACSSDTAWNGWDPMTIGHVGQFGPSVNACPSYDMGIQVDSFPMNEVWYSGDAFGLMFTAPTGTRITALNAEGDVRMGSGRVSFTTSWFHGFWDPDSHESWQLYEPQPFWRELWGNDMSLRRLAFGMRCEQPTCDFAGWTVPFGGGGSGPIRQGDYAQVVRARRIRLTIRDDVRPTIQVQTGTPAGWRRELTLPVGVSATDNVGVLKLRLLVDGKEYAALNRPCYAGDANTFKYPCGNAAQLDAQLAAAGLTDGAHEIRLVAEDVAGNVTTETLQLWTDHGAPGAPRALQLNGGDGWRGANRFDVQWESPPADGAAPIEGAEYELCPAANAPRDASGCVTGRRDGADIARIGDLAVPAAGEWRLRVALRDSAGNLDWDRSGVLESLRFDAERPTGSFLPFDRRDRARVRLATSDAGSGVDVVEIEARRRGDSAWHALPVEGSGDSYSAMINDDELRAGTYEFRARVADRAGNASTIGGAPTARLPIRPATELVVGRRVRTVRHGRSVALAGRLTAASGKPRGRAAIDVFERVDLPGRDWKRLATVRTTASGTFKFRAAPGVARRVRFAYHGTATTRPRAAEVELRVRAGVTLTQSARRVRNGDEVVFKGRVVTRPVPEGGKLLALQARTGRGDWRTFATPRAGSADGRFSARYRFVDTSVTTRYSFRVIVPEEASYPYAWGASKITTVLVRG